MAWTELHDTLPDHPKIKHLAAELGCTKGHAVGVVVSLWCHTLRYGKCGEIRLSYVRGLLSDVGGTDVDGALSALHLCGWIDPGDSDQTVRCHDWDDYAGRLEMIRERDKLRKQAERAELKRLRETSNGHPADVRKSPVESAQPNQAKQDQTKPTPLSDKSDGDREPSKAEVRFGRFWDFYPRKIGKGKAWAVFKRLSADDQHEAIEQAEAYAQAFGLAPDARKQFFKHPQTWLNGRCWEDDHAEWQLLIEGK